MDLNAIQMTATDTGNGYTLDGVKSFVLDGHVADLILVAARADADFPSLRWKAARRNCPYSTGNHGSDAQTGSARIQWDTSPTHRFGRPRRGGIAQDGSTFAAIALSAEAVGGARSASICRSNTPRRASSLGAR